LRGSVIHPIRSDNPALYDTGVGPAIFAPKGHLLVTSDGSHSRLWDATNPDQPRMLSVFQDDSMLFSPDARTLVSSDGKSWDVSDPSHPEQIPFLPQGVYAGIVAVSPDGGLLATSDDSKITLFQLSTAGKPRVAGTIRYPASQVAFAATGRTLTAGSYGGRVGFWDVSNPAKPIPLSTVEGRKGGNAGPVFSPNGHYVAIPENDGSTQLWNVQDPRHPTSFVVLDDATPLAFDPNGKAIAVYAADGSLQLRQIDVTAAIKQLCAGTPTISRNTWSQYAPTLPYQPPCDTRPARP
jgi:WD40 repeat protein